MKKLNEGTYEDIEVQIRISTYTRRYYLKTNSQYISSFQYF